MSVRELERQYDTYFHAESLSIDGIESILDSMPLGNYEESYNSRRNSFNHDWNEYVNGWNQNYRASGDICTGSIPVCPLGVDSIPLQIDEKSISLYCSIPKFQNGKGVWAMNDKERMDLICAIRDIQTDLDQAEKRFVGHVTEYLFDVQRFHNAINESLNDLIRLLEDSEQE